MKRKYIGYGYTYTMNKDTYRPKYSPVYKKLRAAYLDDIKIEVGSQFDDERRGLKNFLMSIALERQNKIDAGEPYEDTVLVFANSESLGNTPENAAENADQILNSCTHLILLDHPEMSSIDLNGNAKIALGDPKKNHWDKNGKLIFDIGDRKAIQALTSAISFSGMGKHGKKTVAIDVRFRTAYWAWQNYFISTTDAIKLSGMANGSFYLSCDRYRNSRSLLYEKDARECLEEYPLKPIRGIPLERQYEEAIVMCQRLFGEQWAEKEVTDTLFPHGCIPDNFDPREVVRERQKYLHGRGCVSLLSKQFGKGPDYVKHLQNRLQQADESSFSIPEALLVHPVKLY